MEYKVDRLDALIRSLQQENSDLKSSLERLRDEREVDARIMILAETGLFLIGIAVGVALAVIFR